MKWEAAVDALKDALETEWVDSPEDGEVEAVVTALAAFGFAIVQHWPEDIGIEQSGAAERYARLDNPRMTGVLHP